MPIMSHALPTLRTSPRALPPRALLGSGLRFTPIVPTGPESAGDLPPHEVMHDPHHSFERGVPRRGGGASGNAGGLALRAPPSSGSAGSLLSAGGGTRTTPQGLSAGPTEPALMPSHSASSLATYNAQRRYEQQYKALSAKLNAQDGEGKALTSALENVQRECRRLQST